VRGPNHKGAVAEIKIAAAAVELGIPVLAPLTEHGRYDLAFEIGSRLLRVQCKWAALDRAAGVVKVYLQTSCCTPAGYVRTSYAEDEIDLIAAYCGALDRCYLLPAALVARRSAIHLRLSAARNGQRACINLASDFEFAGAVAQLEERRHGMAEARGSSPLSSTPPVDDSARRSVGAHEFRERFGYHLERAAGGEEILITRHGRPFVGLVPLQRLVDAADSGGSSPASRMPPTPTTALPAREVPGPAPPRSDRPT
jgi:prevent-host-death family protein